MSFVSDFLRDLKFGPIEAARRRADEIADYGYPEPDTSTYNPPPPPEPDFGQWDALAANEGVDPYSQDYSSDEALTGWDNANGGWMGAEIPASEQTVEPYYPEEPTDWGASIPEDFYIPDFGFGGFTGIDEPPSASSFSERLAQWRAVNRPGTDPYADVAFADPLQESQDNGGYVTPARIPLYEQLAEPDFGQWDSLPTPGAETSFEYQPERNPELERWAMAQDDASYPGTYELNLGWSPPVSAGEDFTGNQKYYDINEDGTYAERRNPVMGEDGDSWDWTKNAIGEGLHIANVAQTAPKEIASDFFPLALDFSSGQVLNDLVGGGKKGSILEALTRFGPIGNNPLRTLSDIGELTGIYKPGTGYDDARRPFTTALESDDPWDYAERLTEQNSKRPFMQQLAGELINPVNALGAGLIGDDAPRLIKGIDTAADWLQGGPILNAAIEGVGRGAGAVTGALKAAHANEVGSGPNPFSWIPDDWVNGLPWMRGGDEVLDDAAARESFAAAADQYAGVERVLPEPAPLANDIITGGDLVSNSVTPEVPVVERPFESLTDIAKQQITERGLTDQVRSGFRAKQFKTYREHFADAVAQGADDETAAAIARAKIAEPMDKSFEGVITPEQATAAREFLRNELFTRPEGSFDTLHLEGMRIVKKLEMGERLQPAEQEYVLRIFGTPDSPLASFAGTATPPLRTELYDGPIRARDPLWKPFEGMEDVPMPRVQDQPQVPSTGLSESGLRQVVPDDPQFKTRESYNPGAQFSKTDPNSIFTPGQQVSGIPEDLRGVIGQPKLFDLAPSPAAYKFIDDEATDPAQVGILSQKAADAATEWRKLNYDTFDSIGLDDGTGRLSRIVNGGDLPSKLANTITLRGRELAQALEHTGISRESAERVAKSEISSYMDSRLLKTLSEGDLEGSARQALAALNMGDFRDPTYYNKRLAAFGLDGIDKDAGKVPGWFRTAETISAKIKNQKFGFLDINAIGANVLPAIEGGFPAMASKMLNEIVGSVTGKRLIDFEEMYKTGQLADPSLVGLNIRPKGLDVNPGAGTLVGGVGNIADSLGAKKVGTALNTVDRGLTKYNYFLTDVQYNKILGGQRKAIYEGNLLIMKMTGKDVTDPAVQRTAAEMANALTSAANLATRNGRRAVENTSLTSASFLRAQGELLKQLSNIVTGGTTTKNAGIVGKAVSPERIMAASTLLSLGSAAYIANSLADGNVNMDPLDPKNFGTLTVPNGNGGYMRVQLFPQKQLARGIAESFKLLKEQDPKEIGKTWAEFFVGRAAPIPQTALNVGGAGFDPDKERYTWGGWGDSMTSVEKVLALGGLPSGLDRIFDVGKGEDSVASLVAQVSGLQTYDEGPVDAAIRDDISSGLLLIGTKYDDIKADPVLNRQFNDRHPAVWEDDGKLGTYQQIKSEKRAITSGYEAGMTTTGEWRDNLGSKNDEVSGAFREMGIEPGEGENPAQKRQAEFQKTYSDATNPDTNLLDFDKLDKLQTEFWEKYNTAEDRKAIIAFQVAGASGPAEVMYIKDKARLRGFDPDTGKRLTFANGKPLPDYYELKEKDRYQYTILDNTKTGALIDRFEEWRGRTGVQGDRADLLAAYLNTVEKRAPDGKPWDAARLADVNNYGKDSKETLEFQAYKNTYKAWTSWDDQQSYWSEIERLHNESNSKGVYIGKK